MLNQFPVSQLTPTVEQNLAGSANKMSGADDNDQQADEMEVDPAALPTSQADADAMSIDTAREDAPADESDPDQDADGEEDEDEEPEESERSSHQDAHAHGEEQPRRSRKASATSEDLSELTDPGEESSSSSSSEEPIAKVMRTATAKGKQREHPPVPFRTTEGKHYFQCSSIRTQVCKLTM